MSSALNIDELFEKNDSGVPDLETFYKHSTFTKPSLV